MRVQYSSPAWQALLASALLILTVPARSAQSADQTELNKLQGIVVSKADGTPLLGVQVVMAHAEKGRLQIGPQGGLNASGEDEREPQVFARRNAKFCCDAFTDEGGHFTLRSFAAPQERWHLAAGDREHGLALLMNIVPADYAEKPLRIEIDAPADIQVNSLPTPPDKSLECSVDVDLVPTRSAGATSASASASPPATWDTSLAGESSDGDDGRVYLYPSWQSAEEKNKPWHLGPFPPGFTYRVRCYAYNRRLGYYPTLFARTVSPAPGTTATVVLESQTGARIAGRVTDTDGKPLVDVNVMVKTRAESGLTVGTLTDAEGRYVLSGVPSGTHTLELLRHVARTAPT